MFYLAVFATFSTVHYLSHDIKGSRKYALGVKIKLWYEQGLSA